MSIKKTAKQLFAAIVALVLSVAMVTPAFAAEITVNNAVEGQTYTAYKLFDVTNSGNAYAYTTTNTTLVSEVQNANIEGITFTQTTTSGTYNVIVDDGSFSAANFAAWISENLDSLNLTIANTATGSSSGTAVITVDDAGYYFVTSSVGTLCFLRTATDEIEIDEKNVAPTVEKKANESTVTIGDTVEFTITINAQPGAMNYVLHDSMTAGLTFGGISSVQVNGNALDSSYYTVSTTGLTDGCTFEIRFNQNYLDTITEATDIVVTYTATVNENAISVDAENSAHLEYGNEVTTTTDTVKLPTYSFDLVKTDESKSLLDGAKFKLYTQKQGGDPIYVVATESGYRVATSSTEEGATDTIEVSDGSVTIDGLANGTYWLEEVAAPDGYNMLTSRVSVTISDADNSATIESGTYVEGGVYVENKAGSLLPSTGGTGTTMLYVVGGALVVAAGVALVVRRRMSNEA